MFLCVYIVGNEGFNIRGKEIFKKIDITDTKENGYKIAVNKSKLEIRIKFLTI